VGSRTFLPCPQSQSKRSQTPFACSLLYVRDRHLLTDALDVTPEYLRTKHGDTGAAVDFRNWQLALGRKFRSLKVWFVLRGFGVAGFRAHIRQAVQLAEEAEALVRGSSEFEMVQPRSLALLVFRYAPAT
jgi:aromatic-L-amino-acid decarboxylase